MSEGLSTSRLGNGLCEVRRFVICMLRNGTRLEMIAHCFLPLGLYMCIHMPCTCSYSKPRPTIPTELHSVWMWVKNMKNTELNSKQVQYRAGVPQIRIFKMQQQSSATGGSCSWLSYFPHIFSPVSPPAKVTMDDGSLLFEAAKHPSPQQAFEAGSWAEVFCWCWISHENFVFFVLHLHQKMVKHIGKKREQIKIMKFCWVERWLLLASKFLKPPNLNPARPDHSAAREAAWVGP